MPKNPSSNPHGLTVGQELFFVNHQTRSAITQIVSVVKIGRKWADLSNRHRIDMVTFRADGGGYNSPGTAYLSEQIYRDKVALSRAWQSLTQKISGMYSIPTGMTIEKIDQIADLLGIDRSEA